MLALIRLCLPLISLRWDFFSENPNQRLLDFNNSPLLNPGKYKLLRNRLHHISGYITLMGGFCTQKVCCRMVYRLMDWRQKGTYKSCRIKIEINYKSMRNRVKRFANAHERDWISSDWIVWAMLVSFFFLLFKANIILNTSGDECLNDRPISPANKTKRNIVSRMQHYSIDSLCIVAYYKLNRNGTVR